MRYREFENKVLRKMFGRRKVEIPEFGKYIIWEVGYLISLDEIKNACRIR
jgi:hypothetical protein